MCAVMKETPALVWVACCKRTAVWATTTTKLADWQFSQTYNVTNCGSGWRNDVVDRCLEFAADCLAGCALVLVLATSGTLRELQVALNCLPYTSKGGAGAGDIWDLMKAPRGCELSPRYQQGWHWGYFSAQPSSWSNKVAHLGKKAASPRRTSSKIKETTDGH